MRKPWLVILLGFVLIVSISILGCGSSGGTATNNQSNSQNNTQSSQNAVTIKSLSFQPSSITVAAGTTVTWTNEDSVSHTVTGDGSGSGDDFDSGTIGSGQQFSQVFDKAGTYPYHCSVHPNMKGTVVVTGG